VDFDKISMTNLNPRLHGAPIYANMFKPWGEWTGVLMKTEQAQVAAEEDNQYAKEDLHLQGDDRDPPPPNNGVGLNDVFNGNDNGIADIDAQSHAPMQMPLAGRPRPTITDYDDFETITPSKMVKLEMSDVKKLKKSKNRIQRVQDQGQGSRSKTSTFSR
jgi:hypothetical protein